MVRLKYMFAEGKTQRVPCLVRENLMKVSKFSIEDQMRW